MTSVRAGDQMAPVRTTHVKTTHVKTTYGVTAEIAWVYRVAQNPRWIWALWPPLFLAVGVQTSAEFFDEPGRATVSFLAGGISMICLLALFPIVGGFTYLRPVRRLSEPTGPIPTITLARLHIPLLVGTTALATFAILEYLEPHMTLGTGFTPPRLLVTAIGLYGLALASFLLAGHRHLLRFTPQGLEHHRGRFRTTIPWTEILDLRAIGDANLKHGGVSRIHYANRHNLRAGVQVAVREGVPSRGRGKRFRFNGVDVINVDCSGYKIDPNTLINAIYLLSENPDLRPLLATPEGAELFVGPGWNTRRKMRVGDRWERGTGEILRAGEENTR